MIKKISFHRIKRISVASLFLFATVITQFAIGSVSFAAAKTWSGSAGDGLFSTAANWTDNTAPVSGDSLTFSVTGLVSNVTVNNDIPGLSLTGIGFSGINSNGNYIIIGNGLSIQGAISDDGTGTDNGARPVIKTNLNMTGPLSISTVQVDPIATITMNGFALALSSRGNNSCVASNIGADVIGSGAINVTSGYAQFGGTSSSNSNAYTGAVTVASGAGMLLDAARLNNIASVTVNGGSLDLDLQFLNRTISTPLSLSGQFGAYGGGVGWSGCAGDGGTNNLTLTGPVSLSGNLMYSAGSNTNVTGLYDSNGFTVTKDPATPGIMTVPADTAPDAPTNLVATPGDAQVSLGWDAPIRDGGPSVSDYRVQYKLSSSGTWTTFADGTSSTTSAVVTGLMNASSYDFRVAAINGVGTGTNVTISNITPSAVIVAPTSPRNLVATPSSSQAGLAWDIPSNNGGAAITDYAVQYKLSSSGTWTTFADGTGTSTSTTVTGLTNGLNYDFQVAAVNSAGAGPYVTVNTIAISNGVTVPNAPTNLGLSIDNLSKDLVAQWTAPASNGGSAITNYLIELKLSSSGTWNTVAHAPFTGTSFAITTGFTDGDTYDVRVSAINAQGTGPTVTATDFLYNAGNGSTGTPGSASGLGAISTPGTPNTGFAATLPMRINSPWTILLLGLGSAAALLIAFWPRKQYKKI